VRHDVTTMPFPRAPVELAYGRLLLAHVRHPARLVESWTGQLLAAMPSPRGTAVVHADVDTVEPSVAQAAAVFVLDLTALRGEALACIGVDDRAADELDEALTSRLRDGRRGVITWGMRQVALRR